MICPTPECPEPVTVPGECCPTCDLIPVQNGTQSRGCFFEGDKKFHVAGTKWHPYLPPFGFDRCSMCTCSIETLSIECKRSVACPPLTCPDHEAYRENPMDCCKRCPVAIAVKALSTDQLGDQRASSTSKSPNELLASGGCRFKGRVLPNGYEWHPTVQPFGEVKSVNCHCKASSVKCTHDRRRQRR
ncbi:Chordin [Halotydeus destructor]|nr:Chordin [Halotydeus destructor]